MGREAREKKRKRMGKIWNVRSNGKISSAVPFPLPWGPYGLCFLVLCAFFGCLVLPIYDQERGDRKRDSLASLERKKLTSRTGQQSHTCYSLLLLHMRVRDFHIFSWHWDSFLVSCVVVVVAKGALKRETYAENMGPFFLCLCCSIMIVLCLPEACWV